jgi:hypothetical protein
MKLTAETYISASLDKVWEFSQNPALHQRWDLRFSAIEYLPKESDGEPQRFRYLKKIGFGLSVTGWGETVGEKSRRSSALRFGSTDKMSIISEGTGSWTYRPTTNSTHFSTVYDYDTRYGWAGQVFDRLIFRPAMIWATRWSFDRLRIWIETGLDPELTLRLWITKATARTLLGLVWIHEGLVPKIFFVTTSEIDLVARSGMYIISPVTTLAILGIIEVLFGVWMVTGIADRFSAILALIGVIILPIIVVALEPAALIDPFGGISKNLGLIACALTTLLLHTATPKGYFRNLGEW